MENSTSSLQSLQAAIQRAFDVLRSAGIAQRPETTSVIAYLLVWLRAGYPVDRLLDGGESNVPFARLGNIAGLDPSTQESPASGPEYLESIVRQLPGPVLYQLLDTLAPLRLPAMPQAEYARLFDYALDYHFSAFSKHSGEYFMPRELVRFIAQVFPVRAGEKVFTPFAGTCQLASFLDAQTPLFGQEPNRLLQALGTLRLTAHRLHHAVVTTQDPWQQWPSQQLWDVVLAPAPVFDFGRRDIDLGPGIPTDTRLDTAFVQLVLNSLREGGHAVIPVAPAFLWRLDRRQQELRERLVNSSYLRAVIELPTGLLPGTGLGLALLLLHKETGQAGRPLWFLDAAPYVTGQRADKQLDTDALLQAFHHPQESKHCRCVPIAEIADKDNDYSLSASRYLVPKVYHSDDVVLGNVAQFIPRGRPGANAVGRLVGIRHLLGSNADYQPDGHQLAWAALPLESIDRPTSHLAESALLVATQGGSLKPTWYQHVPDAQVLLAPGVLALRLNLDRIDPEYLVTELNSEYVQRQLQALQVGTSIPVLSRPDLFRLRVRLPKEVKQQRDFVDSLHEQLIRQKRKELDALQQTRTRKSENLRQFAALKHALNQHNQNLVSGHAVLESVIRRYADGGRILHLGSRLNDVTESTVQDTIASLKRTMEQISTILGRDDHDELVVENHPKVPIEIIGYLRRRVMQANALDLGFVASFAADSDDFFGYTASDEPVNDEEEFDTAIYVLANEYLLNLLFDNILDNARRHGFPNGANPTNRVVFEVAAGIDAERQVSGTLSVRVRNNGMPFPLNFDPAALFSKGETVGHTGHTGLGGYQVKEIVGYFDGTIHAAPSAYRDFPVEYFITLPIAAAESRNPDTTKEEPNPDAEDL